MELATVEGDPSLFVIGSLVAAERLQDIKSDGWNNKGISNPDNETCTATVAHLPIRTDMRICTKEQSVGDYRSYRMATAH